MLIKEVCKVKLSIPQVVFSSKMGTNQRKSVMDFVRSFIIQFNHNNDTLTKTAATVYWQSMFYGKVLAANHPLYVLGVIPEKEIEDLKVENSKRIRIDKVSIYQNRVEFVIKDCSGFGLFFVKVYKTPNALADLSRPDWFCEEIYTKEDRDLL